MTQTQTAIADEHQHDGSHSGSCDDAAHSEHSPHHDCAHHSSLGHSHFSHATTTRMLGLSVGLALLILAAEVIGGLISGSLALLSDAAHMVTDVAALVLAWYAQRQSLRPANESRTYGYHRAGIMAAMANAVTLFVVSALIVWEAVGRIRSPEPVTAPVMLGVAAAALIVNLGIAALLQRGESSNLNIRGALLHVLGDAAASAGVIVGGFIIYFRPAWTVVDPILSIAISIIIVYGAWKILQEAINVLMEGTPRGLDLGGLEQSLVALDGVRQVHHMHVWALSPGHLALSGHVVIDDQALSQAEAVRTRVQTLLRERFQCDHATIQLEHRECGVLCTISSDGDSG